jgi:acyl-CoA synthetase (AMP-forming)/AMP-acid ligase II
VLAIIGAGGIFTGSNPAYTPHELAHHIKASESRFLISEPEILDPLLRAAGETGIPDRHVWVFDNLNQPIPAKRQSWKELLSFGEEDWVRFDDIETAQSTTAARLFSSGTTGLPKAVKITHYNLIAQHELVLGVNTRPYPVRSLFHLLFGRAKENSPLTDNLLLDLAYHCRSRFPCFSCSCNPHIHVEGGKHGLYDAKI